MFLIVSCKERDQDPEILPAATQEGKNTGGAIVNGQIWIAKIEAPDSMPGGNNTYYYTSPLLGTFSLQIVLLKYKNSNSRIVINISDTQVFSPQTYPILGDSLSFYHPNLDTVYYTNPNNNGTITITKFDKVNNVVSGTFSFKAVNSAGEVVTITDGRFDRKFL